RREQCGVAHELRSRRAAVRRAGGRQHGLRVRAAGVAMTRVSFRAGQSAFRAGPPVQGGQAGLKARPYVCWFTLAIALRGCDVIAAQYSAQQNGDVVRLEDSTTSTTVSILPSVGNIAFELKVKGQNVLRWPFASIDEFKAKPSMSGIPFLGPWANRLDEQAFYATGKRYAFDMALGNVRGAIPIHGFLTMNTHWRVTEVKADNESAWATSRLEFFKEPAWIKQWPFAHTIEMTYRLRSGALEV